MFLSPIDDVVLLNVPAVIGITLGLSIIPTSAILNLFASCCTIMSVIALLRNGEDFPSDGGNPRAFLAEALIFYV